MIWMRRGDCPAVFSLEILRRNPCTGEESAPRETRRGTQQIFKQTDVAFRSHNTSAPQNGIFIQTPQGLARRGFKNQNPARGRKLIHGDKHAGDFCDNLRTRTPQGDGNPSRIMGRPSLIMNLRTRTPQGDGNLRISCTYLSKNSLFKNQNPARGRKHTNAKSPDSNRFDLRTRTPQGDGNLLHLVGVIGHGAVI